MTLTENLLDAPSPWRRDCCQRCTEDGRLTRSAVISHAHSEPAALCAEHVWPNDDQPYHPVEQPCTDACWTHTHRPPEMGAPGVARRAIVALTSDPTVSHTAWRITRPFAALEAAGIPTQVVPIPGPSPDGFVWTPACERVTFSTSVATLVLHRAIVPVQFRESFAAWVERVRASGVTVVYDTDDDVYSEAWAGHLLASYFGIAPDVGEFLHAADLRAKTLAESEAARWVLRRVDGVTVSTEHLAAVVSRYTDKPVVVVPNAIDVAAFRAGLAAFGPPGSRPWLDAEGVVTIGWCAGYRPQVDALPVAAAWRRIAERYPEVRFVVAGYPLQCLLDAVPESRLLRVPHTDMDRYPWAMQVDIGCCAAADTEFNRSRSPIKAWEFALAGAGVVASETVYGETIRNDAGRFGLVANTADEWESALDWFVRTGDREWCRDRLSRRVLDQHSLSARLPQWPEAYAAIAQMRQGVTA